MPFSHHDRVMGWLLGLAHLTSLLFADALSRSGLDPDELERVASTTFSKQVATAHSVLTEDPELYFAIQRLNPHRGEAYAALAAALGELTGAVERDESGTFAEIVAQASKALPKPSSESNAAD
jgi:prephenate dehydrogenase